MSIQRNRNRAGRLNNAVFGLTAMCDGLVRGLELRASAHHANARPLAPHSAETDREDQENEMNRAAYKWVTLNGVRMQHIELARLADIPEELL